MKAKILGIIMAGGEGSRLAPLTRDRAKPAVPFGGKYRIIDFVLSNFVNSEIYSIYVLVQFKCQSLIEHLQERWRFGGLLHDQFISSVPAQMWKGQTWYQGNADAVSQNLHLIENFKPDFVLIFGADHIYRMDIRQMVTSHLEKQADVTIAAFPVPVAEAPSFGILQVDDDSRITAFVEKSPHPTPLPHDPHYCLASMGNYLFSTKLLIELLKKGEHNEEQGYDFGHDIIPPLIGPQRVYAYDFRHNHILEETDGQLPYWRDVGTLDAYYAANMDLRGAIPALNLYNPFWPIHTGASTLPPAKFTNDAGGQGLAIQSVVSEGCIINGATVVDSVLGPDVFAQSHSRIEESVIMSGCRIERNARIRRAILDKNVNVPPGEHIGWNLDLDRQRFSVSDSGIVVVPKGYDFSHPPQNHE